MNLSSLTRPRRSFRRLPHCVSGIFPLAIAAALMLAACPPLSAQGTRLWTQSHFDEFEKGTPQGVAITSNGKLLQGPLAKDLLTTPSTFVWSVAVNNAGTVFLATGAPSTVLRLEADGKTTTLFETRSVAVQVLRIGPDGALYAATLPDGKVYRLKPDATEKLDESTAEVVFDSARPDQAKPEPAKADPTPTEAKPTDSAESRKPETKSHYIWDMTFDPAGRLYIATGGPAAIYRLETKAPDAKPELFFQTDEQHIRALAWDRSGNLIAGTDGSGLVYRIDPAGKGYVLFSAPRREITALAIAADGTIYAADVGDKNRSPLPQLPIASGGGGITITFVQPGSVQAANASTTLPEGTEIFALTPNAAPRKLWSGKDEIVYKLAADSTGLTALTGNRGRILLIHPDGTFSDIAHLEAQQAVSMTASKDGWLVGTANTGKLYRLATKTDEKDEHLYASDVLDAGALARWGHIEVQPGSHGFQLWTRSGNVEQPVRSAKDWGWTDWQPTEDDRVVSPPGRYLQWKVMLGPQGSVGSIGVNYLPVNSAPAVDDLLVVPGARALVQPQNNQPATLSIAFSNPNPAAAFDASAATAPIQAQKDRTAVTVRWAAHDDDSDDLTYDLYLRGDGEHLWRSLKKGLTDKVYSFDAASIPDGGYEIRVVATDAPSHTPGDALTGELISERFEIDTTAPLISGLKASTPVPGECRQSPCARTLSIPVSFDAKDAASPLSRAEYSIDAGPWQFIEPVGGLSDAKDEHYYVAVPVPATATNPDEPEHLITVRVYDRHDNMATAKVIVPAGNTKAGDK